MKFHTLLPFLALPLITSAFVIPVLDRPINTIPFLKGLPPPWRDHFPEVDHRPLRIPKVNLTNLGFPKVNLTNHHLPKVNLTNHHFPKVNLTSHHFSKANSTHHHSPKFNSTNHHPFNRTKAIEDSKHTLTAARCRTQVQKNTTTTFFDCMSKAGINNETITHLDTTVAVAKCSWQNIPRKLTFSVDLRKDWNSTILGHKGKKLSDKLSKCGIENFKLVPVAKSLGLPNRATFDIKKKAGDSGGIMGRRVQVAGNMRVAGNMYWKEVDCVKTAIWDARPEKAVMPYGKTFECTKN